MNLQALSFFCCSLWAGVVLGISFIAQPAKFGAMGLTRPVALSVGRRIFRALHWAEIIIALCAFSSALPNGSQLLYPIITNSAILTIQVTCLMPRLSEQVNMVLIGAPVNNGYHHMMYAGLEFFKFSLLVYYTLFMTVI